MIAIFSGILHYKLRDKKMVLRAARRQSFGFLRPTLTDAGLLTLRLSLGIELSEFDQVVIETLVELDTLLTQFNFSKPDNDVVKKLFNTKEGKKKDSYIKSCMRGDRKQLTTFQQAQAYCYRCRPRKVADRGL